jgi:hypothetical protein
MKIDKTNEQHSDIKLVILDKTPTKIKNTFQDYIGKVDEKIRKSFNCDIDEVMDKLTNAPDSCCLWIESSGEIIGICAFN